MPRQFRYDCSMRAILLLLLAGCAAVPSPDRADLVQVPGAGDIQDGSVRLTITASGEIWRNHVRTALADLPEARKPAEGVVTAPLLIEADKSLLLRDLWPLLEAIISEGRNVNLAFAVNTGEVERALVLPVVREYMLFIHQFEGPVEFCDFDPQGPRDHIWIVVQPAGFQVSAVNWGPREDVGARSGMDKADPWTGPHEPVGAWSAETLREFVQRSDVRDLSPTVALILRRQDRVDDMLHALSIIRFAGARVVPRLMREGS